MVSLICCAWAGSAHAQEVAPSARANGLDYLVQMRARTSSEDAAITGHIGYGYRLWGSEGDTLSGFIRPNLSGVANLERYGVRPELELFPISPVGVFVGRAWVYDYKNAPSQDCSLGRCVGNLFWTDAGLHVVVDSKLPFLNARYVASFYDSVATSQPLLDSINALLLSPSGEVTHAGDVVAGIHLGEHFAAGAWLQATYAVKSGQEQNAQYAFASASWNGFAFTLAGGRFQSDLKTPAPSLFAGLSWGSAPDLALVRPGF